jgi:hypothetical protein
MTPDEERRVSDEFGPHAALARDLVRLGPLIRRQEQTEAEGPDPIFLDDLEARLAAVDVRPTAAPTRSRRAPRGGQSRRPTALRSLWARERTRASVAAAVVATLLVALILVTHPSRAPRSPVVAWVPPRPRAADLTRDYPPPFVGGAGGGPVAPEESRLEDPPGGPYPGHIRLSAAAIPAHVPPLRAYRLAAPTADARRVVALARGLGIRASVTRARQGQARWVEAVDRGTSTLGPDSLHSLAVSTVMGEVVYHDQLNAQWVGTGGLDRAGVVSAARAWLTRLGWPGAGMPVRRVRTNGTGMGMGVVQLGWAGAGPSALPAAAIAVDAHGRIAEAHLWPPVEGNTSVPARPLADAWAAVRRGAYPLAVDVNDVVPHNGTGMLHTVTVVQVLVTGADRRLYLVPTYRFAGTAQLQGVQGAHGWYALVPAAR